MQTNTVKQTETDVEPERNNNTNKQKDNTETKQKDEDLREKNMFSSILFIWSDCRSCRTVEYEKTNQTNTHTHTRKQNNKDIKQC